MIFGSQEFELHDFYCTEIKLLVLKQYVENPIFKGKELFFRIRKEIYRIERKRRKNLRRDGGAIF